jgi:hypothetical protein
MTRVWIVALVMAVGAAPLRPAAQSPTRTGAPVAAPRQTVRPGTTVRMSGIIRGTAVDAEGTPLANTTVRLRDARVGRIIETTVTDKAGAFTFRSVDPGSYIVEIVGRDRTVLATSDIINVDSGTTVNAVVKLPFNAPPVAALGRSTGAAVLVMTAAAGAAVLATQITGEQKSPRQ